MRIFVVITLTAFLSACSHGLQSYVNKDINEAIIAYGQPENIMALPDGSRAYQWSELRAVTMPMATNTQITPTNTGYNALAFSSPALTKQRKCVYTLIAKPEAEERWVVSEYRSTEWRCH